MRARLRLVAFAAAAVLMAAVHLRADELTALLDRVGARVAAYYGNAQNLLVQETIRIQHEDHSFMPLGRADVIVYDDHVEWTPGTDGRAPEASVVRELLKVNNGRPRKPTKDDDWRCFQHVTTSAEPLSMLLDGHRDDYLFSAAGHGKADGRESILIEYRARVVGKPSVVWDGRCVSVELPGREHGRIWIDAETDDVLRVDEDINGRFSFDVPPMKGEPPPRDPVMTLEHASTSTRYQLMTFADPEEVLIVPKSIETADRWSGNDNVRITQTFSNYRRFEGTSHIVQDQ